MKKYLVKVDQEEFVVQIRLLEDEAEGNRSRLPKTKPEETVNSSLPAVGEKIEAPLGGTILQINVAVGDRVKTSDTLMTLEALKLENEISAPFAGRVSQILTTVGATVDTGETLLILEKE